jgi:polysaccharide deacetylase family protein (PEP-CTERM system associated)
MKTVFLTIDIEEWYHLDYLKKYEIDREKNQIETVPKIFDFLDILDRLNIKATFFVLGEIAYQYGDILRDIRDRGHEIACHGLDHELLHEKTVDDFKNEVIQAKMLLDEILGSDTIKGYRASCFSMDRKKLDILRSCGYSYDSSYISFAQHPLYGHLDLSGYNQIGDLVYEQKGFYEFEIPTIKMGKFNLPISGGGYLRLIPFHLISFLIKKYLRNNDKFILYLHPFELTDINIPFPKDIAFKDKFRAQVGRKGNLKKLEKVLLMLMEDGAEFKMIGQYKPF